MSRETGASGFAGWELQAGASAGTTLPSPVRQPVTSAAKAAGFDAGQTDRSDVRTVQMGIDLYNKNNNLLSHPLTREQLDQMIRNNLDYLATADNFRVVSTP